MTEVDILILDNKIQEQFRTEENKLSIYKQRLGEMENLDKFSDLRNELAEKIRVIETQEEYNFYITETIDIVTRYKELLRTPVKVSFMGSKKDDSKENEKREIINKYLSVAKKYMSAFMPLSPNTKKKIICDNCKTNKNLEMIDTDIYVCISCGLQIESLTYNLSYKDIDRTNIIQKYTYDPRIHFRDCINQYQGKQNCNVDKTVYEELEEQYEKYGLLVGDKDTPKEIRFAKVKKEHTLLFLKELKLDKHYDNVNLIYSNQTEKKCDDIEYLVDTLMSDFDMLISLYEKRFKHEKKIERKNFINTQYVLYQLLNKHKHPCKKEDFNILKTVDRKTFHDDTCKELFEELEWNHTPYF